MGCWTTETETESWEAEGQDRHDVKHSISQVKGLAGRFGEWDSQNVTGRQGLIVGVFSIVILGMQRRGV